MSVEKAINHVWSKFARTWGSPPEAISYAPGRVNLIGDHTEYNGGLALPVAINRWIHVGVRRDNAASLPGFRVHSENMAASREWRQGMDAPEESWMAFVHGAYTLWSSHFKRHDAFDLYVSGDIPQGIGLSSSSAFGIALLKGMVAATRSKLDPMELGKMAQRIENDYLGWKTGLLDQMAVVFGKKDSLLEIDFQQVSHQYFQVPELRVKWIVVDSGMRKPTFRADHAQRIAESSVAFSSISEAFPEVQQPREVTEKLLNAWLYPPDGLPGPLSKDISQPLEGTAFSRETLFKRARHFLTENKRVEAFKQHLLASDVWAAGDVLDQSHRSLRDDNDSSSEECDWLQAAALKTKGCMGSRIIGEGFGGCTLNMVVPERAELFLAQLLGKYKAETGLEGRGFVFEWENAAGATL